MEPDLPSSLTVVPVTLVLALAELALVAPAALALVAPAALTLVALAALAPDDVAPDSTAVAACMISLVAASFEPPALASSKARVRSSAIFFLSASSSY